MCLFGTGWRETDPEGICNPGQVYIPFPRGTSGMIGVFRLESQMLPVNGKLTRMETMPDEKAKKLQILLFNYLNRSNRISGSISTTTERLHNQLSGSIGDWNDR